jgi:hypothetical protein
VVTVRLARPGDEGEILRMIVALAVYEHQPDAVLATEESLAELLFAEQPSVFAFIAEIDGRPVGLALWFLNYSTWTGRHGIYLEDLFVEADVRLCSANSHARRCGAAVRESIGRCWTGTRRRWPSIAGSAAAGATAGSRGGWRARRWRRWQRTRPSAG